MADITFILSLQTCFHTRWVSALWKPNYAQPANREDLQMGWKIYVTHQVTYSSVSDIISPHSKWIPYSVRMRKNADQKNSNFGHFSCWVHLMTYRYIAEKQWFEKYCSCYNSCSFSALSNRGYLEKPSIDEYKCVQLFLRQTIWSSKVTCS